MAINTSPSGNIDDNTGPMGVGASGDAEKGAVCFLFLYDCLYELEGDGFLGAKILDFRREE